ncbi:MAG TPA: hypothetical protein VFE25_07320 [Opitutaceae bacterium]|nr:hypothetical protein [Opitutaceae bacterium]
MPSDTQSDSSTETAVRSKMNAGLDEKSAREVVQAQASHDAFLAKQSKKAATKAPEPAKADTGAK